MKLIAPHKTYPQIVANFLVNEGRWAMKKYGKHVVLDDEWISLGLHGVWYDMISYSEFKQRFKQRLENKQK